MVGQIIEQGRLLRILKDFAIYRARRYVEMLENNEEPVDKKEFIKNNFK